MYRCHTLPIVMDEKGVILNKELFEVLSSDTRIDILKSLNTRRKTNSELAKELSLKASTIHHHLERLDDTGLIKSIDSNHKWIYYELTPKGNALLNPPKNTKFTIIISSLLTYTTAFAALYTYYTIPRLHVKSLYPHLIDDPFSLLFLVALIAVLLQTVIIVAWYLKK